MKALPQDVRPYWLEAMVSHRVKHRKDLPSIKSIRTVEDLESFVNSIDLAAVDAVRALELGLEESEESIEFSDSLEICRFEEADQAKAFERAIWQSSHPIPRKTLVSDLWRERFAKLAEQARNVILVDGHAFNRFLQGTPSRVAGLERLLGLLDAASKPAKVEIIAEEPEFGWEVCEGLLRKLRADLRGKGVSELWVYVVPRAAASRDDRFARIMHDRYLRFGKHAFALGSGAEVFQGTRTERLCTLSLSLYDESYRDEEGWLRGQAREVLILAAR
ncbi:MAG: hypothetical protein ABI743_03770 [bacterium]